MLNDPLKVVLSLAKGGDDLLSKDNRSLRDIDWEQVVSLAKTHGLFCILYKTLNKADKADIPESVFSEFKNSFFKNSYRNLSLSATLIGIYDLFTQNNIAAIPIKGPLQSELIYKDIGARAFADLDILIRKKDVAKAMSLLKNHGYRTNVDIPNGQLSSFLNKENFFELSNETGSVHIDLHWELTGRYATKPVAVENLVSRTIKIDFLDRTIQTLSYEDLLIYLCIHSTSHCWDKLEPIISIAEIINAGNIDDWEALFERARKFKCKRMVMLGMMLAEYFFDAKLPVLIHPKISAEVVLKRLSKHFIRRIENNQTEFSKNVHWRFSAGHFFVRDSVIDGIRYFFRLFFQPTVREWDQYPLPDRFLFLYHFLRPYRILAGKIKS